MQVDIDAVNQNIETHWQDDKRYAWLLSPAIPALGTLIALSVSDKPKNPLLNSMIAWGGPLLVHGMIPLLDVMVGEDASNPPAHAMKDLENDPYYERVAHAFIPLQFACMAMGAHKFAKANLSWFNKLGLMMSVGVINGIGINTAHELGHKSDKLNRHLARLCLAPTAYGHFAVEHNFGHHLRVATPEDPASSRFGETFWQFLPRTVIGSLKSAVAIESKRLARRNNTVISSGTFWTKDNELLQGWAMTAGLYALAYKAFGKKILPFMALQGMYGFSMLEVVNYIEHYGLLRQKIAEKHKDKNSKPRYERTRPEHSWNSNHVVTNLVLYQLQRHSDHHAHPKRSYQMLRHFDDTPQLPSGYASMILPAYIPPLWFKLMNHRVIEHYKGDMSKINISPKIKPNLLARAKQYAQKIRAITQ